MNRKQAPKPHPDWFWSMSGGLDSTAAFLLTKDIVENYSKTPVMLYFDTRIGLPSNRLYLEELADVYGVQLWTLRTNESFKDWVSTEDCPGPPAHGFVRNVLKGRQASKINTLASDPVHIIGLRASESPNRARFDKVERKERHVEVYPVHRLTEQQCARIVLEHDECPINPCWTYRHATDCFCLANGDPSELDEMAEEFPWFAQRIREIEEASDAEESIRNVLGWGGLTGSEQEMMEQGVEQMTLCGSGCQRERDSPVQEAFNACIDGSTREKAIDILDGYTDPEAPVVTQDPLNF